MIRALVNIATGRYMKGQARLRSSLGVFSGGACDLLLRSEIPAGWPTHGDKPYAFKAYALRQAADNGADLLLWCDASILPLRSLEPLWERIEREGYWMSTQRSVGTEGYTNYEWTADSAYADLFPEFGAADHYGWEHARGLNRNIEHVIATAFGLNMRNPTGRAFFDEYFRLASTTRAFCGPYNNGMETSSVPVSARAVCGPSDVRGHRHDQTAASVIAWRLGMELTQPPAWITYRGHEDESTILCVDGNY